MTKYKSKTAGAAQSALGDLDGLFSRLGKVLNAAADLVQKGEDGELSHVESIGNSHGMRGMYGFSVRVAPVRRPVFRKPSKAREEPAASLEHEFREPVVDVFDEGDHFVVVAQFLGADESAVRWRVNDTFLKLEATAEEGQYYKELELPSPIDEQTGTATCKNGILELRLWKQ